MKNPMQIDSAKTFSAELNPKILNYSLIAVLGLAMLLRVIALIDLSNSIYFDTPLIDEAVYHQLAAKIAAGDYNSTSVYEFPPFPAYLMALVYKSFSPNPLNIRIMNLILGTLICLVIYGIGKELAGSKVGLIAGLIAALYEPFIFYSTTLLKASLAVFLFGIMVYLCLLAIKKPTSGKILLLGLTTGLMLNTRPNIVLLIPVIPLFVMISSLRLNPTSRLKSVAIVFVMYLLGFITVVSPFLLRNYLVAEKLALTTTQTGQNLYYGNNPEVKLPYYQPLPFAHSSPFKQGVQFTIEASRRTDKRLSSAEASSYWTKEVARLAVSNPIAFIEKLGLKVLVFFNRFEMGDHFHIGFLSRHGLSFFRLPFIQLWLILPFAMATMILQFKNRYDIKMLSCFFLLYGVTLIIFFTNTRYRLPLLTILIPLAVMALLDLYDHLENGRSRNLVAIFAIAAIFFIIQFLPVRGVGELSPYYNIHARMHYDKGKIKEAAAYWKASSEMKQSFSVYADISLAALYYKLGDQATAFAYIERVPDTSFNAAMKYELLGDIYLDMGQKAEAISAFRKSLEINSGQLDIWNKLKKLCMADKKEFSEITEKMLYYRSFYNIFD